MAQSVDRFLVIPGRFVQVTWQHFLSPVEQGQAATLYYCGRVENCQLVRPQIRPNIQDVRLDKEQALATCMWEYWRLL